MVDAIVFESTHAEEGYVHYDNGYSTRWAHDDHSATGPCMEYLLKNGLYHYLLISAYTNAAL
jgi:hypothetical protein